MGCRNLSLCQEMAGHHLKGLEGCTVILYKLTIYFSGAHFLCKTLCTGSRLFIEGVAAPEWVFEESLVNEVRLLTKIIIETATVFHYPPQHCTAVAVRCPYTASYDPGSSFSELTVLHFISTLHPLHPPCSRDWENFTKMEDNPRYSEPM